MKRNILIVAVTFLCTTVLFAQGVEKAKRSNIAIESKVISETDKLITEKHGNTIYKGYKDSKGRRQGCWREYNHQGLLRGLVEYKDGLKNGVSINFNAQGSVEKDETYKNNKLHGNSNTYSRGHYIIESANYTEGVLDGAYIQKYSNNPRIVMEDSHYKMGKKHGIAKWYTDDGKLLAEYYYEDGLFNGVNKTYYPNGSIKLEENYKNNIPVGVYKEYYEDGKTIKLTGEFKDGKREGRWNEYDVNGKIIKKLKYSAGILK